MRSNFQFTNLLGAVYRCGNVVFVNGGNAIISPIGNRITYFDLVKSENFTFPFENRRIISLIAINPQETLLISIDEDGRAILCNLVRRCVLHHFNFKEPVYSIAFAPNGNVFAVGLARHTQVWKTPNLLECRDFAPFVLHRKYAGHFDRILRITWSSDSRFFLTASKDLTSRIFSVDPEEGFKPTVLAGHRENVIGAFFTQSQETIYTVSKDGALFEWAFKAVRRGSKPAEIGGRTELQQNDDNDEQKWTWMVHKKHFFMQQNARVTSCDFIARIGLLAVGFSSGVFTLYELPGFVKVHSLRISDFGIDSCSINSSGEWIALTSAKLGQMLVWEWQSESYIFRQQGHSDYITSLSYSHDGQRIVTAADDGKIKIWSVKSGFCIVTFDQHQAAVTGICHSKIGNAIFSSSLDGSVRAFDLLRYRNFRVFTAPDPVQFSCVDVDPQGEIVCAGCTDSFEIYVWSVQTGILLDTLSGHEGPVTSLSFSSQGGQLVSGSWDHSVQIWDVFGRSQYIEPLAMMTDVLAVAMRPDCKAVCIATLDGNLSFWNLDDAKPVSVINCRKDISGGRKIGEITTAKNSAATKYFTSVSYTADGSQVIAAGNSKYICIYDVDTLALVKRFRVSQNMSIDGTRDFLNSKNDTEAGPIELIDRQAEESDLEDRIDNTLPGASRGDLSKRKTRPEIRVTCVKISPTGDAFAASTTEGLMIYSISDEFLFDPFDLDIDITSGTIEQKLKEGEYLIALIMAFRLNENVQIRIVYSHIPPEQIEAVASGLPRLYLDKMLRFCAGIKDNTPHIEFLLRWLAALLRFHGNFIKNSSQKYEADLKAILGGLLKLKTDIISM